LYAPLAQVGTGSYKQPSYTPTTLGFSGKQGATTESSGEIIPNTQETEQSKYMKGIAETLEKMTPGHSQVGMIESGLGKIVKAGEQANPNQIGDTKNLSALLNLGVGLGETALGAVLAGTPAGAANFQPFEVATNYLPENVSGWLMPVSNGISKYYDGKPPEEAQNIGFVLDTALFMLLHKGYNAAKKGVEVKNLLQFDDKEVAQAVKASEERLKQYGGNTTEYREAVMNDNTATIDQMKEASHVALKSILGSGLVAEGFLVEAKSILSGTDGSGAPNGFCAGSTNIDSPMEGSDLSSNVSFAVGISFLKDSTSVNGISNVSLSTINDCTS